ncbi:NADPH-dependent ferric siderophore reductase [Amycolatopsis antarctica]|uniref:NADPH-dependent ferric siderophore reductase n=1 Tax=Amycolatopsis antarctica TaxID=1854586 RepID=A0A263D2F9_9PSEU|nr:siderophore-interacting protein [Amycolatopsis antarctica]OZM71817.1 NADPH-dependent ferric siderophore reductase [Amycolatopsis antarctica]
MTTASQEQVVEVEPFLHAEAQVVRAERITPSMVRVRFGGPALAALTSGGPDQRVKIFLPRPGQIVPEVPTGADWYARYREMPDERRPAMRTYTVRSADRATGELDIDFVQHGDTGPASAWAARAQPGDQVVIWGPNVEAPVVLGSDYAPPADSDWQLIAGDETALPAIGGIVEGLAEGVRAKVFVEIPEDADRQEFAPTRADVDIVWLPREGVTAGRSSVLVDTIRAAVLPDGAPYAWIAGEAGGVRELRRHLVNEREFDRKRIHFCGYWRAGKSEDAPYEASDQQD